MDGAIGHARRLREDRGLLGACAVLFAASATATIAGCASMSAMGSMVMPGGWMLSMAWLRMPGQTWPEVAASLLGMWLAMMAAMMLPSLLPMLWRYRRAVGRAVSVRLDGLTALVAAGYFGVWALVGAVVLPLGFALAQAALQMPTWAGAVPLLTGTGVLFAGALQMSAWKARRLACCRAVPAPGRELPAAAGSAWRHGLQLGLHCTVCCAPLMVVLFVAGVMDLRAMAAVTLAITIERLLPAGERAARVTGAATVAIGVLLLVRAIGVR